MKPAVAVVLAAGRGTRMNSDLPKVLHPVCGRPMIEFVLDALQSAGINHSIVVVGYEADLVRQTLAHRSDVAFADQIEQLGTGHAVMMCRGALRDHEGPVLVVTGDSPLAQPNSISALLAAFYRDQPAAILGRYTVTIRRDWGALFATPTANFRESSKKRTPATVRNRSRKST